MQGVGAVILAAGQGKRMRSETPKVLHCAAGRPLVRHVLDAVEEAGITEVVVVIGQGADMVREALGPQYNYALQEKQLGTGDAVLKALPHLSAECKEVLVVCGDTPLLRSETLAKLVRSRQETGAAAAVLTGIFEDPQGYGRIIRTADDMVEAIVEESDATVEQKRIQEINTGSYAFTKEALETTIHRLQPDNKQGEYYLTDCIYLLREADQPVTAVIAPTIETAGINTRRQLADAERILREWECERLMSEGVTIYDPSTTYVDKGVQVGQDTIIYPFTFLEGKTIIGRRCVIGPGTRLHSVLLGDDVSVQYSVVAASTVGNECQIGPYSHIRPGNVLADQVKIGGFVELKASSVGEGSKIPHLSYIGDTVIGTDVNIGAGTITCNYDGAHKHKTFIEDGVFIGSNTNLVAPVSVGKDAVIGAGSTITRDVPAACLAVERAKQVMIPDWGQKKRKKGEHEEEWKNEGS
ncbi:MAG: bifunctional UDP-N-acetylglucosamine diphosphorylase/glucosamine-1-phosphate N-acetyltransferase GlmU [Syntrophaceticus schinkii]|jgi:bifunctional UDP-N-acetylglucosamine pyrophosphorylase/glucosamine-1-phosphate N-acetyltransferase|nr:bifunctional UDP-N-acetylglucosamine diphosphorylase/glucosamine-1-phosphate N-acetyltransferase GlmU [Syntrophaceticus schinkii]MDD4260907.1 bifunctional UDP-N-acetylglucosamine diphosphorylase/glucosamine-1-phosphate N-acetyltransferase GlmU [Syntrophaceticus schinkii]MDD4675647.1 bifunctional UDP-N-acetylglucosamine diphosphorylase/glucosamine-1-phosphate N-acetyltransferase GlmU [Syntrophaceticus schinkii]